MSRFYLRKSILAQAATATIVAAIAASAAASTLPEQSVAEQSVANRSNDTDQFIVAYRGDPDTADAGLKPERLERLRSIAAKFGLRLSHLSSGFAGMQVLKLDRMASEQTLRELASQIMSDDLEIAYAEPDVLMQPQSSSWDLGPWPGTNNDYARQFTNGNGVVVAVVDSGYNVDPSYSRVQGYDFVTQDSLDGNGWDSDPRDPGEVPTPAACPGEKISYSYWHGNAVASVIAGHAGETVQYGQVVDQFVDRVAPAAQIQPVRVVGKCRHAYTSAIANGIAWAAGETVAGAPTNATPAKVINVSISSIPDAANFGPTSCPSSLQAAINNATRREAVVVVSAFGQSNWDSPTGQGFPRSSTDVAPGNCANVVTVSSTDTTGKWDYWGSLGSNIALMAPGRSIPVRVEDPNMFTNVACEYNGWTWDYVANSCVFPMVTVSASGTSFAAAHVSGAAALVASAFKDKYPGLQLHVSAAAIKEILRMSAGPAKKDTSQGIIDCSPQECGAGILDAGKATEWAKNAVSDASDTWGNGNDNSPAGATVLSAPGVVYGCVGGDEDWVRFDIPAGKTMTLSFAPSNQGKFNLTHWQIQNFPLVENGLPLEDIKVDGYANGTRRAYFQVKSALPYDNTTCQWAMIAKW